MNKKNFDLWMTSIDNHYLEEASQPPAKKHGYRYAALIAAACLVLAAIGLLSRHSILPEDNPDGITREYFTINDVRYTILSCEVAESTDISGTSQTAATEPLVWYAGGLELKLCSTQDIAWVSWYDTNTSTQWCLTAEASTLALLTTASDIVEELGYHVSVAPEEATDITYDAFLLNDLTVAETAFLLDDIHCYYRMAATSEVTFPFADISGIGTNYDTHVTTEVGWCPAEVYYNENGCGKIIWFDIVPGLLYSLSMETGASEESLLSLAYELFTPAQDNADW